MKPVGLAHLVHANNTMVNSRRVRSTVRAAVEMFVGGGCGHATRYLDAGARLIFRAQ